MHLLRINCQRFRCLEFLEMEPDPGMNIIRGGNAQGKTSILEAVLYAATSKSHRTTQDVELVTHKQQDFHVLLETQRCDRQVSVEAHWYNGTKRFKVNGITQPRMSDILGRVQVVFFSPEDIALIKGSASQRRRFLDMEISQTNSGYLQALQQYRLVLRQRNELLKASNPDVDLLAVWDVQLAEFGVVLMQERAAYVDALSIWAEKAHAGITGKEHLSLQYRPDVHLDEAFLDVLKRGLTQDIRQRTTRHGPHRDDLEVLVENYPARHFGSQGQQRTAALALKLAELDVMRQQINEYPILLLDEVLAELDEIRTEKLFEYINDEVQCLITTTAKNPVQNSSNRGATCFKISGGQIEKET